MNQRDHKTTKRPIWRKRWNPDLPTLDEQRDALGGDELDAEDPEVRDRAIQRALGRKLDR